MNTPLSHRVQRIKPSPTLAVSAKAAALKAEGIDVVSLGAGEPDFDTPSHIKQAAIEAIQAGLTKYTAVEGTLELRKAIAAKFTRDNKLHYEPNQILVSCGGKQSFFNLALALLNSDDEVIIPAPYWVSYPDMVLLADAKPVIIETNLEQQFKITAERLEKAITPKTRLLVINSPSNPTGMAYTFAELKALGNVLLKHPKVLIATDDMYEKIFWRDEPFTTLLNAHPDLHQRTIVLHGVSKTYAMTGWRIGFAAGPKDLIHAMTNIQSQSTSNPCSISQAAATKALNGDQSCITPMVHAYHARQEYVVAALNAVNGIECIKADGTFYAFPRVQNLIDRLGFSDDIEFSDFLLNQARVAVVPGTAFGAPGHIRLSTATRLETLEEAMKRIKAVI